ncbi:CLUMA_CG009157, isoform A [Clunio marinus]|uniref:CLUMA_CG009157, isoform A n=1 Tax=Clunio marinus TaxID=568069 RepID=A0A1J1I680_9DIPT|nr:CLUMA_CG009157, isoform A [Clunio marinus]
MSRLYVPPDYDHRFELATRLTYIKLVFDTFFGLKVWLIWVNCDAQLNVIKNSKKKSLRNSELIT